jgi:hypothetical protein
LGLLIFKHVLSINPDHTILSKIPIPIAPKMLLHQYQESVEQNQPPSTQNDPQQAMMLMMGGGGRDRALSFANSDYDFLMDDPKFMWTNDGEEDEEEMQDASIPLAYPSPSASCGHADKVSSIIPAQCPPTTGDGLEPSCLLGVVLPLPSVQRGDDASTIKSLVTSGHIQLTSIIGSGSFSVVYQARSWPVGRGEDTTYAVKCLFKHSLTPIQLELQRQEYALHARCAAASPFITAVHGCIDTPLHLFLLMDYHPRDLFDAIPTLSMEQKVRVFLQLLTAVAACHAQGVYHRDLKPENILLDAGGQVRLTDFGLATTQPLVQGEGNCGSERYMSPENYADDADVPYSPASSDVWACGVLLVNLLSGRNPWNVPCLRRDPLFAAYQGQSASFLVKHLDVSHELSRVLARVFALDPEARPDAASFARMLIVPDATSPSSICRRMIPMLSQCTEPISIVLDRPGAGITGKRAHVPAYLPSPP